MREVCRIFKICFVEDDGLAVCSCFSCCNVGDDDAFRRFGLTEEVNVFNLFCFKEAKHRCVVCAVSVIVVRTDAE